MQLELNDETERFQCEITDLQMKLDAARAENFELERILKEQKHWIEVLEDNQNQNISPKNQNSTPEFTNSFGNDTPPREEHENIGFTLLSLEVRCIFFIIFLKKRIHQLFFMLGRKTSR